MIYVDGIINQFITGGAPPCTFLLWVSSYSSKSQEFLASCKVIDHRYKLMVHSSYYPSMVSLGVVYYSVIPKFTIEGWYSPGRYTIHYIVYTTYRLVYMVWF